MLTGLFAGLAALSGLTAIAGVAWMAVAARRRGRGAPAETRPELPPAGDAAASRSTGRAPARRRPLSEWLLIGGLLGLLLFGALTLWRSLSGGWLGLVAVAIAIAIAIGEVRGYVGKRG